MGAKRIYLYGTWEQVQSVFNIIPQPETIRTIIPIQELAVPGPDKLYWGGRSQASAPKKTLYVLNAYSVLYNRFVYRVTDARNEDVQDQPDQPSYRNYENDGPATALLRKYGEYRLPYTTIDVLKWLQKAHDAMLPVYGEGDTGFYAFCDALSYVIKSIETNQKQGKEVQDIAVDLVKRMNEAVFIMRQYTDATNKNKFITTRDAMIKKSVFQAVSETLLAMVPSQPSRFGF